MDFVFVFKKSFFIILITFYLGSCSTKHKTIITSLIKKNDHIKIGFGSCLNQDKAMPIFNAIKEEKLDLFLMIGDNVYGDSEEKNLKLQSKLSSNYIIPSAAALKFRFCCSYAEHK